MFACKRAQHMRSALALWGVLLAGAACAATSPSVTASDFDVLADGVGKVNSGRWTASKHYLFGPAYAVGADESGTAMISATRASRHNCHQCSRQGVGRLIHFGHEGMLGAYAYGNSTGMGRLLKNAAGWLAAGKGAGIRLGWHDTLTKQLVLSLVQQNSTAFSNAGTVSLATVSNSTVDVLVANGQDSGVGTSAANLKKFLEAGGGILIGSQAWNWGKPIDTHPTNLLVSSMGIMVSSDSIAKDVTLTPGSPPPQTANAEVAASCIEATLKEQTGNPCYISADADLTKAMEDLGSSAGYVPFNSSLWDMFDEWIAAAPTSTTGIDNYSPIQRRSLDGLGGLGRTIKYKFIPPEQVPAAPDAKFFPGLPPAGTQPTATSVKRTVNGSMASNVWQCLATYAMPGTVVTVTVPASLASVGGVDLHIGGWTDKLYRKTEWVRLPEIVRWYSVTSATTKIASAFGGLIYIRIPANKKLGSLSVDVAGAILAPYYYDGASDPKDWANQLKNPAPWGEIGSRKLVLASPRYALKTVMNVTRVTNYWDKVMDAQNTMSDWPIEPDGHMRMQHDTDISVGYMHSGYPFMTFMDVVYSTLDPVPLKWGHYHELGHNHQDSKWTWECTGEVTVNFFSAYTQYMIHKQGPSNFYGWYGNDVTSRYKKRAEYLASPSYATLCSDAGLYLDSFLQVADQAGLGFELIRRTIASYKTLNKTEVPTTNDDKIQTWVKLSSKVLGKNLAPYYKGWGWPVSTATETALASLPAYVAGNNTIPDPLPPTPEPEPAATTSNVTLADYKALADGVGTIGTGARLMSVHVMWGGAMGIAARASDGKPIVSVARYGAGKVLHLGHEGFLWPDLSTPMGRLFINAAKWMAAGKSTPVRIAASSNSLLTGTVDKLVALDSTLFESAGELPPQSVPDTNNPFDIYILNGLDTEIGNYASSIRKRIAGGLGVITGGQAWSYDKPIATHPSNKLLNKMGLAVLKDWIKEDVSLNATTPPAQLYNADYRLGCLDDTCQGVSSSTCILSTTATINTAKDRVSDVLTFLPDNATYWAKLNKAATWSGIDTTNAACQALIAVNPPKPPAQPKEVLTTSAKQSSDAAATFVADKARDNNVATYSKTLKTANPWWYGIFRSSTEYPLDVSTVIITLPNITGFDFSTIHDVQIRVGTALPSSTKVVVDPSTINTLCADVVGPLGSTPGEVVRVACSGGAKSGKVVTVQIRSRTGETDVLQLAEVKVEGTLPTPPLQVLTPTTPKQSTDFNTLTKANFAVDNNVTSYSQTKASASPWWYGVIQSATQPAVKITRVFITLPKYTGFVPGSVRNLEVRVGTVTPPAAGPAGVNTLCARLTGPLSNTAGAVVNVTCTGELVDAKLVSIHIRSPAGVANDTLSLAEVKVEAYESVPSLKRTGGWRSPAGAGRRREGRRAGGQHAEVESTARQLPRTSSFPNRG